MTELRVEATVASVNRGVLDSAGSNFEPALTDLDTTELNELRQAVAAETRAGKLIAAELYRRAYIQAAIDAKAAVIIDEERRLACGSR
jgi:hypothetical protein